MPGAAANLPREVVDVLGQASLGHRQRVQLVRLGTKLLLVSVTPAGVETLSEVTDPAEVERLVALCRTPPKRQKPTGGFRQLFEELTTSRGRAGPADVSPARASDNVARPATSSSAAREARHA